MASMQTRRANGRRLQTRYERGSDEFARVLALTDGVVAIAITLLVLNVSLPVPSSDQAADQASIIALLAALSDQLAAFLVSFVILAYSWVGHHRQISRLAGIDGLFIAWNFGYLLLVAAVPLLSQLIGLYGDNPQALMLYSLGFALLFGWDWIGLQLVWRRQLMDHSPNRRQRRRISLARLIPVIVFLSVIPAVQWLGEGTASWIWLLIWPLELLLDRLLPPSQQSGA
jgi:uncharacterized membrane protein